MCFPIRLSEKRFFNILKGIPLFYQSLRLTIKLEVQLLQNQMSYKAMFLVIPFAHNKTGQREKIDKVYL